MCIRDRRAPALTVRAGAVGAVRPVGRRRRTVRPMGRRRGRVLAMMRRERLSLIHISFKDADIVYPKSWAPFAAMEKRTNLYGEGDTDGIKALELSLIHI